MMIKYRDWIFVVVFFCFPCEVNRSAERLEREKPISREGNEIGVMKSRESTGGPHANSAPHIGVHNTG
jgi:hypothetical protein